MERKKTETKEDFVILNMYCFATPLTRLNDYINIDEVGKYSVDFDSMPEYMLRSLENNLRLINKRIEQFSKVDGPRVGDYIILKDGTYGRFTSEWDDKIQIGGEVNGSYYFGYGYLSHSGGCGRAINQTNMELTSEIYIGTVWFSCDDISGADRRVYANIEHRVFREV